MICPGCGKETPSTSNYCIHCGILVQNDTAPTQLLTPEMEKMMFGEEKAGYTDNTQLISRGNKEYTVVNDGQNSVRGPEYGRSEWNNVSETGRDAVNTVGMNNQSGSSGFSGNTYSNMGMGYSDGYKSAGTGYSYGYTGAESGYSDSHKAAGTGYSDGYTGVGGGYSDGYAEAGYSNVYTGAGAEYSENNSSTGLGITGVLQSGSESYAGAEASVQNDNPNTNTVSSVDSKFAGMDMTPISVLGYIGYSILFALPLVGLVFMIIYSLGNNRKVNLKNYARSYLLMYIIGVILMLISYYILLP